MATPCHARAIQLAESHEDEAISKQMSDALPDLIRSYRGPPAILLPNRTNQMVSVIAQHSQGDEQVKRAAKAGEAYLAAVAASDMAFRDSIKDSILKAEAIALLEYERAFAVASRGIGAHAEQELKRLSETLDRQLEELGVDYKRTKAQLIYRTEKLEALLQWSKAIAALDCTGQEVNESRALLVTEALSAAEQNNSMHDFFGRVDLPSCLESAMTGVSAIGSCLHALGLTHSPDREWRWSSPGELRVPLDLYYQARIKDADEQLTEELDRVRTLGSCKSLPEMYRARAAMARRDRDAESARQRIDAEAIAAIALVVRENCGEDAYQEFLAVEVSLMAPKILCKQWLELEGGLHASRIASTDEAVFQAIREILKSYTATIAKVRAGLRNEILRIRKEAFESMGAPDDNSRDRQANLLLLLWAPHQKAVEELSQIFRGAGKSEEWERVIRAAESKAPAQFGRNRPMPEGGLP